MSDELEFVNFGTAIIIDELEADFKCFDWPASFLRSPTSTACPTALSSNNDMT